MAISGREKKLTLADREITCHELSAREVIELFNSAGETLQAMDPVEAFLLEDAILPEILRMTDLTRETALDLTPAELEQVAAACKEVNPRFFQIRGRFAELGRQIRQQQPDVSREPASS
ncbi:MAG: hypothetical protein HQL56_13470 [Magnetococcales bacterium]|nr:hypothetical protein [Magnetococcales bacterium]